MAIAVWKPGTLYLEDALVRPTKVTGASPTVIPNADFDSGDTGYTKGTGWAINTTNPFGGTYSAEYTGTGAAELVNDTKSTVQPGKAITARAFICSANVAVTAAVHLKWYDAGDVLLSTSIGNSVGSGSITTWLESTVSATAPANAAKVSIGVTANGNGTDAQYVDNLRWNYVQGVAPLTLAYKNIATDSGTSGATEPAWPSVAGNTVVDNTCTWEAVATDTITWEASSILTSGSSEPTWSTVPSSFVGDNNIAWETIPFRITDENCPHSKVVAIAASKVFAGDTDVTRFCATLNARDWTSDDDAGFLPSGLQQKGEVGVTAMGVYRGNLAIWSPSTFQIWQVDPDPAAMSLLDSMQGIGSSYQQAVQSVSDDCFFLSTLGVRTVAIAEGTNNLATGDVGVPIDELVQAEKDQVDVEPVATYFPTGGQYWLAFRPLTIGAALLAGQFLLTSPIYPVEAVDSMTFGASFIEGKAIGLQTDQQTADYDLLNASLDTIKLATPTQPDQQTADFDMLDGTLDTVKQTTDVQPDQQTADFDMLDGTLDQALVRHTNPAEALDFTPSFISGTKP